MGDTAAQQPGCTSQLQDESQHAPRPPAVLVIGEALIDVVVTADGSRVGVPGGSPANVALGLGRLGFAPAFLSHFGADADGRRIADRLAGSGVRVRPESLSAERTPTAEVTLDGHGQATYRFDVTWELDPGAGIDAARAVHVGSYSAFMRPGALRVRELAAEARAAGALVSCDPNIRPALIGGPDDVRGEFEHLAGLAHVVKLSDEDAAWLYPGDTIDEVLTRVLALGVELAAVTRGGAGAMFATRQARAEVPAPETTVADTIGAGDSFMAALVARAIELCHNSETAPLDPGALVSLSEADLTRLGEWCGLAAAITVSRRGADLPSRAEIDAASLGAAQTVYAGGSQHHAPGRHR